MEKGKNLKRARNRKFIRLRPEVSFEISSNFDHDWQDDKRYICSVVISLDWIQVTELSEYIKTQKRDKSLLLAAPSRREAAHWWPHLSPNFPHTSSYPTNMPPPPSHSTGSPTPHSQMSRLLSPLVPISSSSSPDSSVLAYLDFHAKWRGPKT